MNHADFRGGSFIGTSSGYGSFSVEDSSFADTMGFYIWYPTSNSVFARNVFDGTSISVGTGHDVIVSILDNSFINPTAGFDVGLDVAIVNWAAYGSPLLVRGNTFSLEDGEIAIALPSGYTDVAVTAVGNYFGTTDNAQIRRMILDRLDDLSRGSVVDVRGALDRPSTNAPDVPLVLRGGAGNDTMVAGVMADTAWGRAGNDTMIGRTGRDILDGGAGNDSIDGGGGNDAIVGRTGRDILTGGWGADVFIFRSVADSAAGPKARDVILDFQLRIDTIDLSMIDARSDTPRNQAFDFIGNSAFSGDAGELRFANGILTGDVNGDRVGDSQVVLRGIATIQSSDLIL